MNEQEILAKAEALAKQHQQDILDARANLVREAIEKPIKNQNGPFEYL